MFTEPATADFFLSSSAFAVERQSREEEAAVEVAGMAAGGAVVPLPGVMGIGTARVAMR